MNKLTSKITVGNNVIYINNNVENISIEALTKADISNIIDYGLYSNKGTLTFFDYKSSFYALQNNNEEDVYKAKVKVYLSSPISNKLIGTFYIDDFVYNQSNKLVEIQLKDSLLEWQNIPLPKIYPYYTKSLYELIQLILEKAYISEFLYDENALYYLQNLYVYCPFLNEETLWSAMTKICQASMCRICLNEQGIPKIYCDYSIARNNVVVRSKNILGVPSGIATHKNKIKNSVISVKDRIKKDSAPVDISLAVNKVSSAVDFIEPNFVGGDETRNGDSRIYLPEDYNSSDPVYDAEVIINLKENTFAINKNIGNDGIRVWGTVYYPNQEGGEYVKHENILLIITEKRSMQIDRENNNLLLDFSFKHVGVLPISAVPVIENIRVVAYTQYYYDKEDIPVYSNPTDFSTEPINVNSNELMQYENYFDDTIVSGSQIPYYTWFLNEINDKFSKGVACVELDCTVGDYYNPSGTKMLDGSGKTKEIDVFEKHDIVIPYMIKNGAEQPYKLKSNGSPATFIVVGVKYSYNGILRQQLLLQEKI